MSELRLEARRTAVVAIDLQEGIVGVPGEPHSTATVVENSARLLAVARDKGAQAVLVHVGWAADGADRLRQAVDQPMRASAPRGPDWSDFVAELDRQPGDVTILKRQWGAFHGTDLDLQLRRREVTTIVLCGIATEFGVESTARDAYERGYEIVFAEDAMTGRSAASHANAIERIFPRIGRVRRTEEIVAAL